MTKAKRLYRSKRDRLIAGVCGGLGHYFNIDPVIVRALFIGLAFIFGSTIIVYLVLWVITPEK
jgi:phage shock protein C